MEKDNTTIVTRKIELKPIYSYDPDTATLNEIKKEKEAFWKKVRLIDNWGFRIANITASECWSTWSKYQGMLKKDMPKITPYKIFSEKICVDFPQVKELKISNIALGITGEVKEKVWSELYDYFNGKKSLPNYKSGYPLHILRNKSKKEIDGYELNIDYK